MLEHTECDAAILKQTSDCTIVYKSRHFSCSQYICGRLSCLLRSLLEVQNEIRGDECDDHLGFRDHVKITIDVPDNDRLHPDALETVLKLMHSNESVHNLDEPSHVTNVITASDYLGCPEAVHMQLVQQLWSLIGDDPIAVKNNASLFMHESSVTKDALTQMFSTWPSWEYWKVHLIKSLDLDATTFRRVALLLVYIFPAVDVFRTCLEACRQ